MPSSAGSMEPSEPTYKTKVRYLDEHAGIAYVESGTGEMLVFVHGSLCDYRYWYPQLAGLSLDFRVLAPSLAHYYPRLPSAAATPFSWQAHAVQLGHFLEHLHQEHPDAAGIHLIGHSRGACVAYQTALRFPKPIRSLTLVDPGGPQAHGASDGDGLPGDVRKTRELATRLIADGAIDEGLRLFVDSTSRPGFWDRSAERFKEMARDNANTLLPQSRELLPAYRAQDAQRIACPTLLVDGNRSPAMYRDNAEILSQWIPDARRFTIGGASHGMTWTHAKVFGDRLRAFVTDPAAR